MKVLITSALPYANGPLHFGHIAGAYLPADCHARFRRSIGDDVHFICGSDEHGVAVTLSAEKAGRSPQEHVDIYHKMHKELFKSMRIDFDHFSRTTWEGHVETTYSYFNDLLEQGFIEDQVTDQLYSEEEGRFLADRYVQGTCPKCGHDPARGDECPSCGQAFEATDLKNPRSAITGSKLTLKATRHWFLMLDKFKERLTEWIDSKTNWRPNVVNFVKKYIEDLRPRAITRDSSWGIPVPLEGAEGKVLYVWFDAPIGYISASKQWDSKRWKDYWCDPKTQLINFIGKDNIPFHAVVFPAMTMGQKLPFKLVDDLPANEFYKLEGRQFSKSDGWYIDLDAFFKDYSVDQIRYAIAANAPESSDSEFTWKDFQSRCNADLLGKFGNLVHRVLTFARANCEGVVPKAAALEAEDVDFVEQLKSIKEELHQEYLNFRLRRAARLVMELAEAGNAYFDRKQPWKARKDDALRPSMETTIYHCICCLKDLAIVSYPIIPETAESLWRMLGQEGALLWDSPAPLAGTALEEPKILFQKIEDEVVEKEVAKLKAMGRKDMEPLKAEVDFAAFEGLDLRVGIVKQAERVPKSKNLLKLQVDIGLEERTVVSGIRKFYSPEDIIGRKVVVVANLKPAKFMGIESQGMILAASHDKELELVGLQELPPGTRVS